MSMDYYIYLKHPNAFSVQSFEQYCSSLGLHIELHPSFNLLEDAGFSPIRLIDERFVRDGRNHDFLSGFELYSSEYQHVLQPQKRQQVSCTKYSKQSLFEKHPLIEQLKMPHG